MKKYAITLLAFLFTGFILTSCSEKEEFEYEGNEIAPSAMLTDGAWDLEWISFTHFEDDGTSEEWTEAFGVGTDNGICTFEFSPENTCVMVDVTDVVEDSYSVYDDGTMSIGDVLYRVEELTDDVLDLVVFYGDEEEEDGEQEHMHFTR